MPARRSQAHRAKDARSRSASVRRSTITKSLRAPCILVTLFHSQTRFADHPSFSRAAALQRVSGASQSVSGSPRNQARWRRAYRRVARSSDERSSRLRAPAAQICQRLRVADCVGGDGRARRLRSASSTQASVEHPLRSARAMRASISAAASRERRAAMPSPSPRSVRARPAREGSTIRAPARSRVRAARDTLSFGIAALAARRGSRCSSQPYRNSGG